jgi:uncharacterized protein (DUF488 family)
MTFFTIGHSTHPLDEFVGLLTAAGVSTVVDVRRLPGSRRNPQFDHDSLLDTLPGHGLGYTRIVELAGRRGIDHDVPFEVNGLWRNRSFHNYADYAMSASFTAGLDALRAHPRMPVAIMCSEAVWWRCHRRIIADHLLARGEEVVHLMPSGDRVAASLTPGGVIVDGPSVRYPAPQG